MYPNIPSGIFWCNFHSDEVIFQLRGVLKYDNFDLKGLSNQMKTEGSAWCYLWV